jgi:hypothetical protein
LKRIPRQRNEKHHLGGANQTTLAKDPRRHMKTRLTLLAIGSSLVLAAAALRAQNDLAVKAPTSFPTNVPPSAGTNAQTWKHQRELEKEQLLLPAGVREKLKLTDEQKTKIKQIEADFATTSQEYKAANQPRLDAAIEENRQARAANDKVRIQAARAQLQQVWTGLQPYRVAAVAKIKQFLTPDQLKVLEDAKNQWHENQAGGVNDRSEN